MPAALAIGGDVVVRRLGFGAMRLCGPGIWGWPEDRESALCVIRRAVELGVQLIDTAAVYGPEVNELQIAQALRPYPSDLVIATKGGSTRGSRGEWGNDGRPEAVRRHCEGSLERLGLETIALYQLHAPDRRVPIEETMGAFAELQSEGKIRHVGVSNVTADDLQRARSVLEIASVQNRYNIADRESERVLELCQREGIAFLPYFPIARGTVAEAGGVLVGIAAAHAATPAQVALAWLLAHSTVICPIPGTSSLAHLEENMAAAALELSPDELAALDRT